MNKRLIVLVLLALFSIVIIGGIVSAGCQEASDTKDDDNTITAQNNEGLMYCQDEDG